MTTVALLSHGFQAEYEIGFANGIAHNNASVVLIGSDNTLQQRSADGVTLVNLRGSQDPARPWRVKLFNVARYAWRYLGYLARHRGQATHLIGLFTTRSTTISLVEAWLTRMMAGRFVLTVHNLLPHDQHTAFNRRAFWWLYRAPEKLVVHTPRMAGELHQHFGIAMDKIVVVEHGIDRFLKPDPALRAHWRLAHGIPAQAKVALFFGMVARYKGPDLLLRAFETAGNDADMYLVIAGRCRDSQLRAEMQRMLANHPHRSRVLWLDRFVEESEVEGLMQGVDCMLLPYRHIDQSGVLFMALSAGLSVVATNVGMFSDIIEPAIGDVIPTDDAEALATAMAKRVVNQDAVTRQALISKAERFDWRHTVKPMAAVYAGLAGARSRSTGGA